MQSIICISERKTLPLQSNKVHFIRIGVSPVGKGLQLATLFLLLLWKDLHAIHLAIYLIDILF